MLSEHVDTILPKIYFSTHQAYKFIHSVKEGLNNLDTLIPLREKMNRNIFWLDTKDLPSYIEFDYIYPNGKTGDIVKYFFDEYGENNMVSGILWHGKIEKKYVHFFEMFYSSVPLSVSEDPKFHELFKYHIPTIIDNRLMELAFQKANYFERFREYQKLTEAYGKEQTKKRTEIYSQLILQGQTSPKWKSEAQLFALVSSVYPDAIYQYRADWLRMQSLDIFIPSISTGIEYQGIQHYKPVEVFGGENHFKQQQDNDKKKRDLCKKNGVTLIEWPYNEKISKINLEKILKNFS
jgi:hypothetical protein